MRIQQYENGAIFDFNTAPAWFQTNWFLALCVLCSALLIFALAVAATLIPARRAAAIEPMQALRTE